MVKILLETADDKYSFSDLLEVMKTLRSPGGCPWDREQTHRSIRNDTLEEAYEVADAIDNGDAVALCEELGDMLLQVVFHSRIAEENGHFTVDDVVDGITKKLVLRHPHVFGEAKAENSGQVLDLWDAVKRQEKHQESYTDTLKSVPTAFPALMRGAKVQKRAKKAGVDLCDSLSDGRLDAAVAALKEAIRSEDKQAISRAYGEALFCMAGLQNSIKVDAEEALAAAVNDFIARFEAAEAANPQAPHKAFK